jgi:nicotinate-nucleotide adenylyltransferase
VVFVPAGHPYFKANAFITPAEHRVNMLKLAIGDKPYFKISLIEIERPGPSYAVDTISRMKSQLNGGDEIFFIMGWDSLLTLPLWQEPERMIKLCRIIAAPRPGYSKPDIRLIEKDLPGLSQRSAVMDKPLIDISATEIRERVRQGLPVDDMVPLAVAGYIKEKGLYSPKSETRNPKS